jgi:hypothetical protein
MVSQEFQGEFIRKNVAENLYTVFGKIEPFSENKTVPCCFETAEILLSVRKNLIQSVPELRKSSITCLLWSGAG